MSLALVACAPTLPAAVAPARPEATAPAIDWPAARELARDLLTQILRLDTTNPPGRETTAADAIASMLAREQIETSIVPAGKGRASLYARLRSARPTARPLILWSHLDVVPADHEAWPRDAQPFAGQLKDGAIWGRGAIDAKGLTVVHAITLVLLHRHRIELGRDVLLVASADGEGIDHLGASTLLEQRPELLSAEIALTEGGASIVDWLGDGRTVHAIATSEKGFAELLLTAEGVAGDPGGAVALDDRASARLGRALGRVQSARPRPRLTEPAELLLSALAGDSPFPTSAVLSSAALSRVLMLEPLAHRNATAPLVLDTIAVTRLSAGPREATSVIPDRARAVLRCHLLPGTTPAEIQARVRALVGDPDVHVTIKGGDVASSSEIDPAVFELLARNARVGDGRPEVALPSMAFAPSDARVLRRHGIRAYGFTPFVLTLEELGTVHGRNERLSLENLDRGLVKMLAVVRDLGAVPGSN